ncbi:NAD(P)/FAD-dependent oxidoreductase [Blastomonas sp. CCH13-E1]|uniref:FAD-dependent oxidoreductase n=1 Tax=Blastomonas sp. CCH13-E1 TaxID=1768739 RepID=UPI0009E7F91C|nr:NAD(P)/FAD-dependent oxidoreductase [Blastomonas sp. CCH13-E1]
MEAATVKGKAKGVQPRPLPPALRITFRVWLKLYAALIASARPLFDLAVRLIIAQGLLASGLVKLMDWERALTLASQEYPVSFLSPPYAAALGLSIELGGAVLLALGLMTRGAALAVARHAAPWYLAGLRLWLALALVVHAGWLALPEPQVLLPLASFAALPPASAALYALLMLAGFAMPLVSLLAILGLQGAMLMGYGAGLPLLAMATLGLFIAHGSGRASIDAVIAAWLQANVLRDAKPGMVPDDWPHVVIVGGGFGGLACALALRRLPVRITLIDRQNYHLFQPLLYQIATAALSPADVAIPIRQLFRADGNVRVLLGEVDRVDAAQRTIGFGGNALAYDYLVLATGATHSYFGRDDWAPFAPGLKRVEDAIAVRAALLGAFEKAESCGDPARARRLLTFVIIGAGPTGVELAGAIAELARHGLEHEYRSIDPADARVILVQAADRILPAFPPELSAEAAHSLERLGVEIRLDARVTGIEAERVLIGEEAIESETVLWAAGVAASPAGRWLNAATDPSGRVTVDPCLRVAGQGNVFVIGDAAASLGWQGKPVPGLAPAAKQAGQHVARLIGQELRGKPADAPFIYRHQGSLATIGRKSAIADFGWLRLHGAPAWWLWGAVHIGFLAGFRNRAAVIVNWLWSYATQRAGIRLITMGERG